MKKSRKRPRLTILNPQPFEVLVTIQPKGTNVIESKKLPAKTGKWVVGTPGVEGTWINFSSAIDNKHLAGQLLPQGTTLAELILDTEIAIVYKQNLKEKLILENATDFPVVVEYELQKEPALSTNKLKPRGQKGASVVAEQQPNKYVDLWIVFKTPSGSTLTSYVASEAISIVGVTGKANYFVGTSTP